MTYEEIFALYKRAKTNVNLAYKKPGGRTCYCFLDITKPLRWKSPSIRDYAYDRDERELNYLKDSDCTLELFKQDTKAAIYVHPKDLWIQNEKKAAISKVLYGS